MNEKASKILMVVGDPNFSYSANNSAVATYLLQIEAWLTTHGYVVKKIPESKNFNNVERNSGKSPLKRLIKVIMPKFLKSYLTYRKILAKRTYLELLTETVVADGYKPDLVIEFMTYGSDLGLRLKRVFNCKLLLIYDSPLAEQFKEMYPGFPGRPNYLLRCEANSVTQADGIICYSEAVKDYIRQNFNPSARVYIHPCIVWKYFDGGVNLKNYIGFVGSFLSWHRVDLLVKAFEKIAPHYPNLKLALIGYGEEWNTISLLVQNSTFKERIEMPGFVSEDQLNDYKSKMLIGVMPGSNWYGSPLKLFEYALAGIAIISTETPTIRGLFNKDEVMFIDRDSPIESLAKQLKILIDDSDLRKRYELNAKSKMKGEYAKSNQFTNFTKTIDEIIHGN